MMGSQHHLVSSFLVWVCKHPREGGGTGRRTQKSSKLGEYRLNREGMFGDQRQSRHHSA